VGIRDDKFWADFLGVEPMDWETRGVSVQPGAVVGGWIPAAGTGKHVHLNGGQGLRAAGSESDGGAASFESGWDAAWNGQLATTADAWSANLLLPDASTNDTESQPVLYATWYEAYSFCIWDGGFLPSEAEWNYAASGGGGATGQRTYPWASPPTNDAIDCTRANYLDCGANGRAAVGSTSPPGDGAFGQADLAGNVWEWNLDGSAPYVSPCVDCVERTPDSARARNGGSFHDFANDLLASARNSAPPETRFYDLGLRCARAP
jgi:formylglycine-generating enzyme required for sulfatase activity